MHNISVRGKGKVDFSGKEGKAKGKRI